MSQFLLKQKTEVEEQSGILYEYEHVPSGARLLWMSTSDKNKFFSVTFQTVPWDSTGVFHILEHSVLCGSRKYPVKDPSMELEKGSLNTFLNAMTFADHTTYPVSSRNEQDFFNLMSVYLDAVFCPLIFENPGIFYQEGWHYEPREEENGQGTDECVVNGVVYNEMKGNEDSVDSRLHSELTKLLFPDTCYRHRFGGTSREIPTLKYEDFLQTYRRFYRGENAIFYLEGDLDIEKAFSMIEEYLSLVPEKKCPSDQDPANQADCDDYILPEIELQDEIPPSRAEICYPIASDEEAEGHTQMMFGKRLGIYSDREKLFAAMILSDYLTGSLESPLCSCVLEGQLGQDVAMIIEDTIMQPYMYIQVTNTEPACEKELLELLHDLGRELVENPDLHEELEAIITNFEFKSREHEEPRGIHHNMDVLSSYLYGGTPEANLVYRDLFRSLREKLDTDYYEKILLELLDDRTFSVVVAEPSYTKAEEEIKEERERAAAVQASWTDSEREAMLRAYREMVQWQTEPDSEEAKKALPSLSLSDLEPLPGRKPTRILNYQGIKVFLHPAAISDMAYLNLYFPVPAEYEDKLAELSLLGNLLLDLPTEKYDPMSLYQQIVGTMGEFSVEFVSVADAGDVSTSQTYMAVRACYLNSKVREAMDLILETILHTEFEDEELISNILSQVLDGFRSEFLESGNVLGARAAQSSWSSRSAATEQLEGNACYQNLKELIEGGQERMEAFRILMRDSLKDIFTKDQMIVGITVPEPEKTAAGDETAADAYAEKMLQEYGIPQLLEGLPCGEAKQIDMHLTMERKDYFFPIPSSVSYAAAGINLNEFGLPYSAAWQVASTILSLEYLWNTIRVKGGAYGTGMRTDIMGNISFYTYRDPSPDKSLELFRGCGRYLREFLAEADRSRMDQYKITSISGMDPLLSPRDMGIAADMEYLNGVTYEVLCKMYRDILSVDETELLKVAEEFDWLADKFTSCQVGTAENHFV